MNLGCRSEGERKVRGAVKCKVEVGGGKEGKEGVKFRVEVGRGKHGKEGRNSRWRRKGR